jgi:hypothetical protein
MKGSFFWVSLSDLMTSLFFIMLVLYVITFVKLKMDQGKMIKELEKLKEIENVETALSTLDSTYFQFDKANKRYKMNVDARFPSNSADIYRLDASVRRQLLGAGKDLYNKISTLTMENNEIEYLLVIEGNTERYKDNWKAMPDVGYKLSYERALALFNFWKENNINFSKLNGQCEVMIAGSGYFGQSREDYEPNNKRFSIQVTSKVGKFLNNQPSNQAVQAQVPVSTERSSSSFPFLLVLTFIGLIAAGYMYYKFVL